MTKVVEYAVRNAAGVVAHGAVGGNGTGAALRVGSGETISLNLAPGHVVGYERHGANLVIRLADGRGVVRGGSFAPPGGQENRLYLSSDGEMVAVYLGDGGAGQLLASYGPSEGWSKYSALDDLRFDGGQTMTVAGVGNDDPVGMAAFIPGLLAGGSGLGTAAAIAGGAAILGGLGGGGGGGGPVRRPTTVDEPGATHSLTTKTPDPRVTVTGTGEPGDSIAVTVGDQTQTTTVNPDGTWQVVFEDDTFPADGTHGAVVVATPPGGGTGTTLDGPTFVIDMTPPAVALTEGTGTVGHVENAVMHKDGVTIGGTGEPGAAIRVVVGDAVQTTTVGASGVWSVTFTPTQVPGGEYTRGVTVTATDAAGNSTTITDTVVIDTVPHPLAIDKVTADNIVNAGEAAAGFAITGTSAAGATVTVTMGGTQRSAVVGADGFWSVGYGPNHLAPGEYDATVTATTTDAAGNPSSATRTMRVDTLTQVTIDAPVAGDDVVNAAEAAGGVALTGRAEPGATVVVSWNGMTLPATVDAAGTWGVTFPQSTFPGGEYASTISVTSTDAVGNTATRTHAVRIDTTTSVSVDPGQAGGDNMLTGAERGAGLVLTGRAEPGASVAVTFEGVTRSVTATPAGTWSAGFAPDEVRQGTYSATVTVTSTDAAGNTASASHGLNIDTEVKDFRRVWLSTGADDILNAAEAAQGLTVTGTVEPGSTVMVRFGSGAQRAAGVAADGTWTVTIPPGEVPPGEGNVTLTMVATDRVGNVATLTETVRVDTVVQPFARTGGPIGGDGILNAAEVAAGLPITGIAEPGATVSVRLSSGAVRTTTSASDGTWSVAFGAADLPRGEVSVKATVTATDRAGNVATLAETFAVDTVAPGSPEVVSFSRDATGLRAIGTEATTDSYSFSRIDAGGNSAQVGAIRSDDTVFNEANFRFAASVPDGSYLVINTADAAGNSSSTLLIVDNTNAPTVDLGRAGLAGFDFAAIDLTFAPDARMTITEAQLRDLTGPENRLMVKGGADDTVTLENAAATGQFQTIDGQRYAVFTLGSGGATLLLDDDIRAVL
ncbi:MAG TPA: Ig-like domain-containing protein [Paracoccaceae bacterium]|nr:Ig-like domain-containing protein [Paracoccaceae bacterium]